MGYKVLNNAFSTLAGSINAIAGTVTVATGHGDRFPVIAGADYTYITLEDTAGNIEILKVTARATASDVMTVSRGQDGTVARNWAAGDIVELRVIAALLDMAIAHVDDTTDAHLASAIKNVPAGGISAVTVQAALNELDSDISALSSSLGSSITTIGNNLTAHLNDTIDAHDASAISYAGGTGISADNVEGAIDELATEKADLSGATFTGDVNVPDESYDATAWNGSLEVPTKNAIRDFIESTLRGTGEFFDYGGASAPSYGLVCDGAAVSRTTYAALFAAIGTIHGAGNGTTTFNVPNIPSDYTTDQANANVGTLTTGENKAHTHTTNTYGPAAAPSGFPGYDGSGQAAVAPVIDSSGGAANLPAGVRVLKCIRI